MKPIGRKPARDVAEQEKRERVEPYGRVPSRRRVVEPTPDSAKDVGRVEMANPGEAETAMENCDGKDIAGEAPRIWKAAAGPKPGASGPAAIGTGEPPNRDPLHGITLERIVTELVEHYGWEELGRRVRIKCFTSNPSIVSSLKFLRRTPWAREKVETLYLRSPRG
jgi:hypothetical protein